jgi:GTP-binding protein
LTKVPSVSFAGSAAEAAQFPRDGLPEVALLGRSNVGKSSLLNALAGRSGLARVSGTPGRTRLVNFFRADDEMYLADLPGYGYAKVPEEVRRGWERLVRSYLEGREPLALCVFLVDARHEPLESDEHLGRYLRRVEVPFVLAATKADKLGRGARRQREEALRRGLGRRARAVVAVSATTGEGIEALWREIRDGIVRWRQDRRPAGRQAEHDGD